LQPCGHVDIYVNGGGEQPECRYIGSLSTELQNGLIGDGWALNKNIVYLLIEDIVAMCSHFTSVRLLIESLRHDNCVAWQKCSNHTNLPDSCAPRSVEPLQIIGQSPDSTNDGIFYMTTNKEELYCNN